MGEVSMNDYRESVDRIASDETWRDEARKLIADKPPLGNAPMVDRIMGLAPFRPLVRNMLIKQVASKARKDHYPAPYAMIDLWAKHGASSKTGYDAEAESFGRVMSTDTSRNLIRVFFLQGKLKKQGNKTDKKIENVHVVGAGVMGGDIAAWCVLRGMDVTLQDREMKFIEPALGRAKKLFKKKLRDRNKANAAMSRLLPDVEGHGIGKADVIIEAVFEDVDVKREIFADAEKRARPDALLATNTSSIPLEELTESLSRPGRLVGLHFFNPVAKMPLVEIVHGSQTADDSLNRASAFTRQISRLPLPVTSTPGFLVNRILMPYLLEAVELEAEGVDASEIDSQALDFGMPMGPVELADTVGLDICLHVAEILGQHLDVPVPQRLRDLVLQGRLGRKSGHGFYRYRKGKPIKPRLPKGYRSDPQVLDRMVLRMLNEAVACLHEEVVQEPDHLDAGMVFGTGFAPFRGGPLRYIETVGADTLLERLRDLEQRLGPRFKPDAGWEAVSGFAKQRSGNG